jgi:exo-beta-1,3-glucanase (GH17 family)
LESILTNYIKQVKQATGKPTTANEQWHIYRDYPNLGNAVDFIMINVKIVGYFLI